MRDLAQKVIVLTGSRSVVEFCPLPQDDPKQRQPNIARARAQLDWEPKVSLEDGLKQTIEYFHSLL
jgi:UDP-glucuronate decarboxylase